MGWGERSKKGVLVGLYPIREAVGVRFRLHSSRGWVLNFGRGGGQNSWESRNVGDRVGEVAKVV